MANLDQQNTDFVADADSSKTWAQSFIPGNSGLLARVELYLRGVAGGNISIHADDGGKPLLASLTTHTTSPPEVTYGWVYANLDDPPFLEAGQTYWIKKAFQVQNVWGGTNVDSYANGVAKFGSGVNWNTSEDTKDLDFKTYMTDDYTTSTSSTSSSTSASTSQSISTSSTSTSTSTTTRPPNIAIKAKLFIPLVDKPRVK